MFPKGDPTMDKVEIIDVKDNVLSKNEVEAEKVRTLLKEKKVDLLAASDLYKL